MVLWCKEGVLPILGNIQARNVMEEGFKWCEECVRVRRVGTVLVCGEYCLLEIRHKRDKLLLVWDHPGAWW